MHPLTSRHDTNTSQWNRCHAAGDGPDPQDEVFANFQHLDERERNLYAIEKELIVGWTTALLLTAESLHPFLIGKEGLMRAMHPTHRERERERDGFY